MVFQCFTYLLHDLTCHVRAQGFHYESITRDDTEVAGIISVIPNDLVSRNLRPCISSKTERVDGVSQATASLTYITLIFTLVST